MMVVILLFDLFRDMVELAEKGMDIFISCLWKANKLMILKMEKRRLKK